MKVKYRGFEIDVKREQAMGGWDSLYYTVIRIEDRWIWQDSFRDSDMPVRELIQELKESVDEYHKDPSAYEEEE